MSTSSSEAPKIDPATGLELGDELGELLSSILVVVPYRGSENIEARLEDKLGLWRAVGLAVEKTEDQHAGYIKVTRGTICKKFLDMCEQFPKLDKLVMIDSDEDVNPHSVGKLAQWDLPVVTGVVCSPNSKRGLFANFMDKDKYGVPRFPSPQHTKKMPTRGIKKIHSAGAGFLCIKKCVIETIFNSGDIPFFLPDEIERKAVTTGVLQYGEDTWFSRQCEKHGFDIYVDFSVHAIHYKKVGVCWPSTALDSEMLPEDFQVDVKDFLHG